MKQYRSNTPNHAPYDDAPDMGMKKNPTQQPPQDQLDQVLAETLSPEAKLPRGLLEALIRKLPERIVPMAKMRERRKASWQKIAVLAIVATIALSTAVYAISQWLSPGQVIKQMNQEKQYDELLQIFDQADALSLNQSQDYEDYRFTLLGMASGKDLVKIPFLSNGQAKTDRTYLVGAASRPDGQSLKKDPLFSNSDGRPELAFRVAPLINGFSGSELNPAMLNVAFTYLLGEDGRYYFLMESDNLLIFADRGVQMAIYDEEALLPTAELYQLNKESGRHERREDYKGLNLLFDLHLDPKLADHQKAEALLQELNVRGKNSSEKDRELVEKKSEEKAQKRKEILSHYASFQTSEKLALLKEKWQAALTLLDENPGKIIRFENEDRSNEAFGSELPSHEILDPLAVKKEGKLQEKSQYLIGCLSIPKENIRFGIYASMDDEQLDLYCMNGEIYPLINNLYEFMEAGDSAEENSIFQYDFSSLLALDERYAVLEKLDVGDDLILENRLTHQNVRLKVKRQEKLADDSPIGLSDNEICFVQSRLPQDHPNKEKRLFIIVQ